MCLDRRGKGGICAHRGLTHLDEPDSGGINSKINSGINKSDIRYLKENLLYLQKRVGFRRKRAGLRFNIMAPKGEGGGQWPLVYFINCLSARDCPLVDRKEHWKTDCCVACDEEPGRAVRFL